MENISSYRAHKSKLTPAPTPTTPNFNCNSPPFLIKNKRAANDCTVSWDRSSSSPRSQHPLTMFELCVQKDFQKVVLPFPEIRPVESQPVKQLNPISASATEGLILS